MKLIRYSLFIILLIGLISTSPIFSQTAEEGSGNGNAATADSLRSQIDAKNAELQQLMEERAKIEEQLEQTGSLKSSLQKELKTNSETPRLRDSLKKWSMSAVMAYTFFASGNINGHSYEALLYVGEKRKLIPAIMSPRLLRTPQSAMVSRPI